MVIDASALIAYLRYEEGYPKVERAILKGGVLLSTINRTEVKGKLVGMGVFTPRQVDEVLVNLGELLELVPFDTQQSDIAAYYCARRHSYNLSLGDCACFALAESRKMGVLTTETAWVTLPHLPFKVTLIR
jgi:PIN domain nuclease of toxin-antitoxin system